jgi:hypothetical protein
MPSAREIQFSKPVDVSGRSDRRRGGHADPAGKERVDEPDQEIQELFRQHGQRQKQDRCARVAGEKLRELVAAAGCLGADSVILRRNFGRSGIIGDDRAFVRLSHWAV